ncbi:hypothetical protein BDN72DRAFT_785971 [Pluteus cervinus]|uniref:Uncharacterized protein n=1 Tax=Pluteus cervinus TaxID=181527 RepID=A0ACD3BDS4_9AGAR|nr:hypothetical protein BDN72DRAFT_785971 [Pluteus cervinus]
MGIGHAEMDMSAVTDTPGSRLRRGPSIAYHHSSLRESRERAVQRSSKSFIIVIPPTSFAQERGQLGHTLASGPGHRLNQGILMPLFPTMYGQLTAIAREFNFPSTTGLCLYLHFTENGVTMSPRLADEHWPFIWAHALESPSPGMVQRLPISGKVEFDIDHRHARWYGAWVSSFHRQHADVPMSVSHSPAPSVRHFRGDSRTTLGDVLGGDDQSDIQPQHRPVSRHVPRKLSLVDRFDTASVRSLGRSVSRGLSPPEQPPASQALSPIFQEDEPKTARINLEHRVKTWRASAVLEPSATGPISLEPANLPNALPIDDEFLPIEPLNLEDFTWSVSSVGPGDYEIESHASYDRLPSPDIAHRMYEDAPPTPTTATSWGPSSYLPSIIDHDYYSRAPSVDIAHRGLFSRPVTPVTATSWGAPSISWPPSPVAESVQLSIHMAHRGDYSRPVTPTTATSWGPASISWPSSPIAESVQLSVHVADRGEYSRPVTPATATSWGAPLSWPASPVTPFYVQTPDAGQRSFDDQQNLPSYGTWKGTPWEHVWPYSSQQETKNAMPWSHVWPYNKVESSSSGDASTSGPWKQVWPYKKFSEAARPWNHVWPYFTPSEEPAPREKASPLDTPSEGFGPWTKVWPYHRASNTASQSGPWNKVWPYQQPSATPWKHVWPLANYTHNVTYRPAYPHFDVYPAVDVYKLESSNAYPHFDLYPRVKAETQGTHSRGITVNLPALYPVLSIYPAVYPNNLREIYPRAKLAEPASVTRSKVPFYPHLEIYPQAKASYPDFDIYPAVKGLARKLTQVEAKKAGYPHFDIYPSKATTGYPHFDIYPEVSKALNKAIAELGKTGYPRFDIYPSTRNTGYPHFDIYPATRTASHKTSPNAAYPHFDPKMSSGKGYPYFDLYPLVERPKSASSGKGYPYFDIYPSMDRTRASSGNAYPHFDLYPSMERTKSQSSGNGYPHFDIYPSLGRTKAASRSQSSGYPHFDIYPAVSSIYEKVAVSKSGYPHFDIYPSVRTTGYPYLCIYPAMRRSNKLPLGGYPQFDIYPAVSSRKGYPSFDLYPAVKHIKSAPQTSGYPHFDIYPAANHSASKHGYPNIVPYPPVDQVQLTKTSGYPNFDIYPGVKQLSSGYPHFDIYPVISQRTQRPALRSIVRYPTFSLYPAVYPHFDLYPAGLRQSPSPVIRVAPKSTHYPIIVLYPPIYPHFDLYPGMAPARPLPSPPTQSKPSSRFTHSELHAMVMAEKSSGKNSLSSVIDSPSSVTLRRQPKSHRDLHKSVFPGDMVSTPSGSVKVPTHNRVRSITGALSQRRMSVSQPPLPSSSTLRRVPPTNGGVSRLSAAFNDPDTKTGLPKSPIPVTQRLQKESTRLSMVFPQPPKTLSRSASMVLPRPNSVAGPEKRVDRSFSASSVTSRPVPKKRDSLVLQRVKAFNGVNEDTTMDALSKFPVPPRPPMPSIPKSLDRSRYPFGS